MIISMIVAAGLGNEIGCNGDLLWRLPKDMQYFKATTMGHTVLMGRKSYESLPSTMQPLPGRVNIVVTRDSNTRYQQCEMVSTIEQGIELAKNNGEVELMILGGGEIYKIALPLADRIYMTRVHGHFPQADTFFPSLKDSEWNLIRSDIVTKDEKHAYDMEFQILERLGSS